MLNTSNDQRKLPPNFEDLFATTAQAPNGVARLRELILTLAVQGKLVAQDANDEPASELLKMIRAEKDRLIAEGKIKKDKPLAEITEEEKTFELPVGWEWVRLEKLSLLVTDGTHHTPRYISSGVPFISVKDIDGEKISFDDCKYISEEEHKQINARCNPEKDDLLICRIGTLGRPTIVDTENKFSLFVSVGLIKLPKECKIQKYLHLVMQSPMMLVQYQEIKAGGSHTNKLNLGDIPRLKIPLPPLAEQSRIVTRVEELMRLCDALEEKGRLEHAQHQQLLQAMLDSLTQTTNAPELARHWQRLAQHFDLLIDRPEAVDALEQTILQLAVRGLLVPQDAKDEPASELLKKIRVEMDRLIAEGKIKKDKPLPAIGEDEKPFELPDSWGWTRLGNIGESFDYGSSQKSVDDSSDVPILRMGNIQGGRILMSNLKYLKDSQSELPHLLLKKGDLLFNRTNSYELVGKTALFEGFESDVTFASYLIRVRLMNSLVNSEYVNFYMNTRDFRSNEIEPDLTQQTGQANYNGTKLKNTRFPLPPLAEQSRIVARVTELRALCQQLRGKLTQVRHTQTQLAQAWVEQVAV